MLLQIFYLETWVIKEEMYTFLYRTFDASLITYISFVCIDIVYTVWVLSHVKLIVIVMYCILTLNEIENHIEYPAFLSVHSLYC